MRLYTNTILLVCALLCICSIQGIYAQNAPPLVLDGHNPRHQFAATASQQILTFENLIPGETYTLVVSNLEKGTCLPEISAVDPTATVLGYNADLHELRFVVSAKVMSFALNYGCAWNEAEPLMHTASLVCTTCKKKKLSDFMESPTLEITSGVPAEELVKDVFIGGNCFDVTGVTFSGQASQIGSFLGGQSNIGFSQGIILATGDADVAIGPNDNDGANGGFGNSSSDGDLSALNGGSLFDLANIEFDFKPTQTPITFEFVFASEEYCEYVNTQFNDVFGFFISGPGIPGTQNLAVVPATTTPITINTINHLLNSGLYTHNTPASGNNCSTIPPAGGTGPNEVQFDGYTKRMTAVANVIPCQTYHIKLKIADVGDGIFDSGVFLKAGSFDAGGNASVTWVVNGNPDGEEVYEGCGTAQLVFERVGFGAALPVTVQYSILGTATNGVDYSTIPTQITIPAGQYTYTLNVTIFTDALMEGQETVLIRLLNPCSCENPEETLIINDLLPMTVEGDTVTICGAGQETLTANVMGGVEPLTYSWNIGGSDPSISPFVASSTTFTVTVTDACGRTKVARARIIVNPTPIAQLTPPAPQLCPGQEAQISVNFVTGTGPFSIEYSVNGSAQPTITDITADPYLLTINQPGIYQLTSITDGAGCLGLGIGSLLVVESTINITGVASDANCTGQASGSINTNVGGGQGPYNFVWQGPTVIGNNPDPTNLLPGTYTASVTDFFGCTVAQTYIINQPSPVVPSIAGTVGPNCTNPNGGSIDLSVAGGIPNYTYLWNNGQVVQDPQSLAQGTYTVTVTDSKGCTKTTAATVTGNFAPPTSVATTMGSLSCANLVVTLDGAGSSVGNNFTYNWLSPPGGGIVSGGQTLTPVVNKGGTYTIVVTNTTNGCTSTATTVVNSTIQLPTTNAGINQTLTCAQTNVNLDGSGSSTGSDFTYFWTASNGGTIIGGETTLNPVVSTSGDYTLVVTNNSNGCTSSDLANVNSNTTPPNATVAAPTLLTCTSTVVTLNGSGSTPAPNLTYLWTTTNGNIQGSTTGSSANAIEAGLYTLVVTNTINGCTDQESVTVNQDNSVPMANANVPSGLDCNTTQLTINGAGSSTGANFTFQWSSSTGTGFVSGQNTLTPTVNAPANYTLLVTNTSNSCTASASVLIAQDNQLPAANAGQPSTLTCATISTTLGDPTALIAPNLTYAWTGVGITGGANTPTPTVNQPGTFNLLVTNTTNGCVNTATVAIGQNIQIPTAIVANPGQLNCTTPAVQLSGTGSSAGPAFSYDWASSTGGGIGAGGNTLTPTVTAAGTYTLIVTNNTNGCVQTASATVGSNANLPTALATPQGILTCVVQQISVSSLGSSSGSNFSYLWGTLNGQISGGQGTPTITTGTAGVYTLLVTNTSNNCTASFSVDVLADVTPPNADAGIVQTLNCTQPSLTLDGAGSSQGGNFTYQWTAISGGNFVSPVNILTPQVNEAGTYQILVTNTQNGCFSTDQVAIIADANDPVVAIATPSTLTCILQQTTLNSAGSSVGSNYIYEWSGPGLVSPSTNSNAQINAPGIYTLVISNTTNGCESIETINVAQNIQLPVSDAGLDDILNCYTPQDQIGGSNTSTGATFVYAWSGPGIVGSSTVLNPVVDQGGTYNLVVTNTTNGCTQTDAVLINTDFALPTANAGPTFQLTCVLTEYTLAASASQGPTFTYEWTTASGNFVSPTTILNPTVNGAGQYYLEVTNTVNGCTQTADVQITQAADVPVSTIVQAGILTCSVQALTLSGLGSSLGNEFTYLWTTTNGSIQSGDTSLNPVIIEPGTYALAVTNTNNNCTSTSSIIVNEDVVLPDIDPGTSPKLTCDVTQVGLTGVVNSNGNFNYQWQAQNGGSIVSGATSLTPTVNATGTYVLNVTNTLNGCSTTESMVVTADIENPTLSIAPPTTLTCTILNVNVSATATGNAALNYQWTASNGGSIVGATNTPLAQANNPGTYTLLVTNSVNGCTAEQFVQVVEDVVIPTADAGTNDLLTCSVTSLELNGDGSSQNGSYFYQWTTTNGQILVGANSLSPTIVSGGTYQLNIVNNVNGCTDMDDVLVTVDTINPAAVIVAPGIITCTQPNVTLNGSGSQGGSNISYGWSSVSGNIVSGINTNTAVVNASGEYVLSVLNTQNGCSTTQAVDVSDNIVLPNADAGTPATLTCTVAQVTLQGTGSNGNTYTYNWTTTGGVIVSGATTLQPIANEPGIYTLTVLNTATGCKKIDEVEIFEEVNKPTDLVPDLDKPSCKDNDGVITFTTITGGVGPYLYSIDGGATFAPTLEYNAITPGNYDLWIQDVNGCEYHEPLVVPKAPDPTVSIIPEFNLSLGDSLQLNAELGIYSLSLIESVFWTPEEGLIFEGNSIFQRLRPYAKPFKNTTYIVTIVSKDGCKAEDRVLIRVDDEPHIYIPNVFTPDQGDNGNGIVLIFANNAQVKKVHSFQIFDRWGAMVFQDRNFLPNDPAHGWDGRVNGKNLTPAVFVYWSEIELIDGRRILYKGDITLVR